MKEVKDCKREMDRGRTMHHAFLRRFAERTLTRERLSTFLIQWYKVATAHRRAFPGLIANIKDDDVRFDLIQILNEEYGNGDSGRIHIRILEYLLRAVGITVSEVTSAQALPSITEFDSAISEIWSKGEAPLAFGLHFGLEYLASAQQQYCARGMAKYPFLSAHDREYFDLHAEAEVRHVASSERGFLHYAKSSRDHEKLLHGVRTADFLLGALWDDFNNLLFSPA